MQYTPFRGAGAVVLMLALTACGGGGGGGDDDGGLVSVPTVPTDPPEETPSDAVYAELSNRAAPNTATTGMAYVLLNGQSATSSDALTITFSSGALSGGLLDGTDIDDAIFTNPANGEFSRIVRISGSNNLFGVVGLDVQPGDLPTAGTVTSYNEGWVGMNAIFEDNSFVLEGDAIFTATWDSNRLSGQFVNLSGTDATNANVTNVGNIDLNNAIISGDTFSGGSVTGTGVFSGLDGGSSTSGTSGTFFGADADELGGVIVINDNGEDIRVLGAFQAD